VAWQRPPPAPTRTPGAGLKPCPQAPEYPIKRGALQAAWQRCFGRVHIGRCVLSGATNANDSPFLLGPGVSQHYSSACLIGWRLHGTRRRSRRHPRQEQLAPDSRPNAVPLLSPAAPICYDPGQVDLPWDPAGPVNRGKRAPFIYNRRRAWERRNREKGDARWAARSAACAPESAIARDRFP
jgi:hypothetical protein